MRILVFFDLPVKTASQRRVATQFRNYLLKDGYHMVQFSVYARVCLGTDAVKMHIARLDAHKPDNGAVRILTLTEKQYESMVLLIGKRTEADESPGDEQLSLF